MLLFLMVGSIFMNSCEGLEDWSNFKIDDDSETSNEFIRYSLPGLSSEPLVEFILDNNDKYSILYNNHIRKTCDYTKIPFNSIGLKQWNQTLKIAPTTRVICVSSTKKLNDASIIKLIEFISSGGTLFIPYAGEDHRMAFLYGFKPDAEFATDITSAGWYFTTPMLPNLKSRSYFATGIHYGFDESNFSNNVIILATALNNKNYPTVIENKIGNGKVILFNTTIDFLKADRGFIFVGILAGLEGVPYPIANTSTIFLDDFPSPLYDSKVEPIKSEMNLSMADFVKKIWWPDMIKLAKEYKIPYSAMTTFDYRNKIVPPFTLDQWNSEKIKVGNKTISMSDWFVKDAMKNNCEIAFHGYNHVSLLTHEWKNKEFIATSLNTAKKKWEISNFGELPITYVPPSNLIDEMGVNELKKAMPSLKYMCSLYLGDKKDGGDREFDYDPYNKDFFDYPRISSGFYLNSDRKYNQESMYIYTGIWTHFVHPDDVYELAPSNLSQEEKDDMRNGEAYGWYKTKGKDKAMFFEFKNYLNEKVNTFPQMRFVTAGEGAKIVMKWRASRYSHESINGIYRIKEIDNSETNGQYWFMFGDDENKEKIEEYLKNNVELFSKTPIMHGYLYSIYSKAPEVSMIDFYQNKIKNKKELAHTNALVMKAYQEYTIEAKKFQLGLWDDDYDEKYKSEMASLEIKMINSQSIDSVSWNKYAKYSVWENKNSEVIWAIYDDYIKKYPTKNNILYSKELDRIIGYPNDVIKEKWMYQQIVVAPNDKELLNSYILNFYTQDNQAKIKKALQDLLLVDPSQENLKKYIQFLIEFQPEEALVELDKIQPSEEYNDLTIQIVWLYADNDNYKKAYEWSVYCKNIDFVTKMNWLIESRQYDVLIAEYNKYILENPDDNKAKALMSAMYHSLGKFKESWVIANNMTDCPEKEELRKMLNKDVIYENDNLQQDLIATQVQLFYPEVLKAINKAYRLTKGDFLKFNTSLLTNQDNLASQEDALSYNHYDKKGNIHTYSGVYNKYYQQELGGYYASNYTTQLLGVGYGFTTAVAEKKPQFWTNGNIEFNDKGNLYFQFGLGITSSKEKRYRSATLNIFPVETAAGVNQKIYRTQLNLYQDFYLFKVINTSISLEGDYYTDGLIAVDTIVNLPEINSDKFGKKVYNELGNYTTEVLTYDNALEGFITLKMALNKGNLKKSKFIPFLEGQYSQATQELLNGYPYWMIESRLYGGGGLAWEFKIPNLSTRVDASYFLDTYSDYFTRYTGNIEYQFLDYTAFTLNFEYFNQDKYYSNSLQFGIKYNKKKKAKK